MWDQGLRSEIESMFDDLVVFMPTEETRFFQRETSADAVARVTAWRARNRERRNATARAARARDPERYREYARRHREKKAGKEAA